MLPSAHPFLADGEVLPAQLTDRNNRFHFPGSGKQRAWCQSFCSGSAVTTGPLPDEVVAVRSAPALSGSSLQPGAAVMPHRLCL